MLGFLAERILFSVLLFGTGFCLIALLPALYMAFNEASGCWPFSMFSPF